MADKQLTNKEALDMLMDILKDRWGDVPDIEQYFVDKSKEFLKKLEKDINNKKSKNENTLRKK